MSHNPGAIPSEQHHPDVEQPLAASLEHLVAQSGNPNAPEVSASNEHADTIHTASPKSARSWISRFFPSEETVDKLFAHEHLGNYVIDRKTGRKEFEAMPLYVRVSMHLLFCSGRKLDSYKSVEDLLTKQSIAQGKVYDKEGPDVLPHIHSFMQTYSLSTDELLIPDLTKYPTFNAFFARRLRADARPIDAQSDASNIVSPADCRLTVYENVDTAKQFWIKDKSFTIDKLLGVTQGDETTKYAAFLNGGAMLAISRLAPQDYHRFHSPVNAVVRDIRDIHGELYTVNPQAINEDLAVFTSNKRSVMLMDAEIGGGKTVPVAFVAVGAMLVGSIGWSKSPGDQIHKGEELGWFQYGGSTVIAVFPSNAGISVDQDLVRNSQASIETKVSVGNRIATAK